MLQSEKYPGDGMDAVASEISLVERSRRCAIHIFTQTRFLEVTFNICSSECNLELILPLTKQGSIRESPVSTQGIFP